jgi:hypothetical protein
MENEPSDGVQMLKGLLRQCVHTAEARSMAHLAKLRQAAFQLQSVVLPWEIACRLIRPAVGAPHLHSLSAPSRPALPPGVCGALPLSGASAALAPARLRCVGLDGMVALGGALSGGCAGRARQRELERLARACTLETPARPPAPACMRARSRVRSRVLALADHAPAEPHALLCTQHTRQTLGRAGGRRARSRRCAWASAAQARVAHNVEAVFDQMRTHAALLRDVYSPRPLTLPPQLCVRMHCRGRQRGSRSRRGWCGTARGVHSACPLHSTALHCARATIVRAGCVAECTLRRYVAVHRIGAVHANNTVDVRAIFEEQREALLRYCALRRSSP